MKKSLLIFSLVIVGLAYFASQAAQLAPSPAPTAAGDTPNPLVWDAMEKTFEAAPSDTHAEFSFTVTNTGSNDVTITQVYPSCGCTTPSLPPLPWKLIPGTNGEVKASMDLKNKSGTVIKTLSVVSTAGPQTLNLKVIIPKDAVQLAADEASKETARRQANMQIAKADKQAVFKGDCAKCHVEKGVGKIGAELFAADCAICHDPPGGHRNEMVTDLAALKHPMTRQAWKISIANGINKPGSLMPAFGKHMGGPLTDVEIDSLVEYALRKYPFKPSGSTNKLDAVKADVPGLRTDR